MTDNDVADSTDWLSTPLAALTAVESSLRCQVCKDFYETPMLTSCSHTFCSLCIRRALSSDNKCPLCRAPEQEIKLRSNWSMEEAVEAFKKARPVTLEFARKTHASGNRSPKRKAEDGDEADGSAPGSKRLRSSARLSQRGSQPVPSYAPEPEEEVVQATDDDEDYSPEPNDGLVGCPSCQKRMKDWQVFAHLEACPGPTATQNPPRNPPLQLNAAHRQHNKSMERLPALSYSMLKENALRKKLAELGISSQGPRSLLERRHKEFITMWNANCDAARPKSRVELLRSLDAWERTQGGKAPVTGRAVQNAAIIKDKDFDGSAWASQHNDSFKDLIANARKSRAATQQKAAESESATTPQNPPQQVAPFTRPNEYDSGQRYGTTNNHAPSHNAEDYTVSEPPTASTGNDAAYPNPTGLEGQVLNHDSPYLIPLGMGPGPTRHLPEPGTEPQEQQQRVSYG